MSTNSSDWDPPQSPHNLVQWQFRKDPWKVLVACVFCNLTKRIQSEPIMHKFFSLYPTPNDAAKANLAEIEELIRPLGLSVRRAKVLKKMSEEYITRDWSDPIELYGIGKYASDAWHIFCKGDWKSVKPKDHALVWYHDWLTENIGGDDA